MFNGCVVLPCTFKSSERIPFFSHDLPICAKSLQSCPTLCNPINYSPPGSSVHGILQVRILGWVAMPSSGDLSHPGMEPVSLMSPTLAGRFFTTSATWEALEMTWCVQRESNHERWCCESAALNMPANLENSAVATELEKVSFHSNPKERQCQRMLKLPHNCTHLTW